MKTIIVKTQNEWDALPEAFDELTAVHICSPKESPIAVRRRLIAARVEVRFGGYVSVVRRSGFVNVVRGGGCVDVVLDGGCVNAVLDGGTVNVVRDGGCVNVVRDGGCVKKYNDLPTTGYVPVVNIGPIGSRGGKLRAWYTEKGVYISCGCWNGSLDEFEARVSGVHKDNDHGQAYAAAVAMIRAVAEIGAPGKAGA